MTSDIFAKLIAALLAAVMLVAPVLPAAAWDEVCVEFLAGHDGHFYVVHGNDYPFGGLSEDKMPGRVFHKDFNGGRPAQGLKKKLDTVEKKIVNALKTAEQHPKVNYKIIMFFGFLNGNENRIKREEIIESIPPVEETVAPLPGPSPFYNDYAGAALKSGVIAAGSEGCVSLRDIPANAPLYVLVDAHGRRGKPNVLCQTRPSDPHWWTPNQSGRKIAYRATGDAAQPVCAFREEQN